MRKTVAILGIPIDDVDTAGALARIDEFIASRRFHQVATANTDFLIRAQSDPELRAILRHADLVLPDGMPLVWASRWLRAGLPERVTGADLVPLIAARAAEAGYRIFMLGGDPESAAQARERLEREHHGLKVVGCESPHIPNLVTFDHNALLRRIADAEPDVLLVAFGNPKQEKWIHMHRWRLSVPACIGVGGTFDFVSGRAKRAPWLLQRSGLEFLHRWRQNPDRLGPRYRRNLAHFPPLIYQQVRCMRRGDRGPAPRLDARQVGECTVVAVKGPLGLRGMGDFQEDADRALDARTHLIVDLTDATRMDSAMLGTLINLSKRAAFVDREVRLVGPNRLLTRILAMAEADGHFRTYRSAGEAMEGIAPPALVAEIRHDTDGAACNGARVRLEGRFDVAQCDDVRTRLAALDNCDCNVELDLRGVSYVDCAALALIHHFAESRNERGTGVALDPGPAVRAAISREGLTATPWTSLG